MPSRYSSAVESLELLQSLDSVAALLRVVCDVSGLGVATLAEVTDDRWTACAVHDRVDFGLTPGAELDLESTLCNHVRSSHDSVAIADVERNPLYCDHPAPHLYGWKSYVSVPVFRPNGTFFGTLCALDRQPNPRAEQPSVIATLEGFARLLGELIAQEERRRDELPGPRSLADFQALREQLLILVEEELCRPLQTLSSMADDLAEGHPAIRAWQLDAERLAQRSAEAADFVRARLGQGLRLKPDLVPDVNRHLEALVTALRAAHPELDFDTRLPELPAALRLDLPRLLKAVQALLEHAAAHATPGSDIRLSAAVRERTYQLQVESSGAPLEPAAFTQLFQPSLAAPDARQPGGLAVDLYLAQESVRGHGGTLVARTLDGRNNVLLTLPTALD